GTQRPGRRWRPRAYLSGRSLPPCPAHLKSPPMTSVGDSFAWPFQDPGWFGKMVIQGLIGIIPIVGWIAMVGWFLMILDNYRAGRRELPAAGFHLERGVGLFVVFLVYVIVFSLPGLLLTGIGNRSDSAGLA